VKSKMIRYKGHRYRAAGHRRDAAPVPEQHRELIYYHGTPNTNAGKKIIRGGVLKPGDIPNFEDDYTGSRIVPMAGRVYLTSSLAKALEYATGATTPATYNKGQYGYLFLIAGSALTDVVPDEDVAGEFVCRGTFPWLNAKAEEVYEDNEEEILDTLDPEESYGYDFWERLERCEFDEVATIGKYLLYYLTDAEVATLLSRTDSVAHDGPVKISEAWRFDKKRVRELKPDGSNFFDLAKRIA